MRSRAMRASASRSSSPSPWKSGCPQLVTSMRSPAAFLAGMTSGPARPTSPSTASISAGTPTSAADGAAARPAAGAKAAASAAKAPPCASTKQRARERFLCGMSVGVQLDPQQLAADEQVVAVREVALALDAHVGTVPAVEIGQRELAAV